MNLHRILRAFVPSALIVLALPAHADPADWVQKSNDNAKVVLDAIAGTFPEEAVFYGVSGHDTDVSDLSPGFTQRYVHALTTARADLEGRLAHEENPLVREDLKILIGACQLRAEGASIDDALLRNYAKIGDLIFYGEFYFLGDQVAKERRPAALARLRKYTGLEAGSTPVTTLAKANYEGSLADPKKLPPYKGEVEEDLKDLVNFAHGIRGLYGKYKIEGAGPALDALDAQLKDYGEWLRAKVLPEARQDFRLPPELYAQRLKEVGLNIDPEQLIRKARLEFAETQNELGAVAALVAKERGFPKADYRSVIRELKKEQLSAAEIEPYYKSLIAQMDTVIRRERIVAMPDRPLIMRLASEAETASEPAPHYQPPPLIGNKGEQGQFVLPLGNSGSGNDPDSKYDDFTSKGAAWTLTAHEGRPGHDLQFTAMLERGVSLARSIFAENSVNVEGWALYAEAEYKPYEPLEGQMFALQLRLQRAARAILDPMLNLGLMTRDRAHDVMRDDVGLSEAMTKEELDRFMFRSPGQATAYFYGYSRLMEIRTEAALALGPRFDRYAFNTFLIDQGLLPPDQLAEAVRTNFIPKYK